MIFIADYWEKSSMPRDIWVVSNCERAELFVNGVSLGKKSPTAFARSRTRCLSGKRFRSGGEIKAVGYLGDYVAATCVRTTPGLPAALRIAPDDSVLDDGGDMTRVVVTIVDANGQTVPQARTMVSFSVPALPNFRVESPVALEDGTTAFFVKTRRIRPGP